jgi:hypothetical protein
MARKQAELRYTYEQVWNAALRMVRVDLRLPVTDRDPEAGFMLFEYLDHDKRFPGSVELVRGEKDRRPVTKVVIQVAGMPAYVEQMMIDRLGRKLKEEYGEPLAPEKPAPEKPKPPESSPSDEPKPEPDPNEIPSN